MTPPDDLGVVVERGRENAVPRHREARVLGVFKRMDVLLTEAFEELTKLAEQKDAMAGIPSGVQGRGRPVPPRFRGGDLVILAARPGVGKTSFALNLATNAAKAGATVTFLSLRMSAAQLVHAYPVRRSPREPVAPARRPGAGVGLGRHRRRVQHAEQAGHVHRRPRRRCPSWSCAPRPAASCAPPRRASSSSTTCSSCRRPQSRKDGKPRRRGRRDLARPQGAGERDGHARHRAVAAVPRGGDARQRAPDAVRPSRIRAPSSRTPTSSCSSTEAWTRSSRERRPAPTWARPS